MGEEKMGDPMAHATSLQESVSFGRFEHDSLCWERWSTFPTNKYLEEVEKCSTPGSVAQKRAYFEAHYKRIAARKSELVNQEMNRENDFFDSEDQSRNLMGSVCNHSDEEVEVERSVTHDLNQSTEDIDVTIYEENNAANFTCEVGDAHFDVHSDGTNIVIEEFEVSQHIEEPNDGVDVFEEKLIQPPSDVVAEHLCMEGKIIESEPEETDFVLASRYEEEDKGLSQGEKELVKNETEEVVITKPLKSTQKVTSKTTNSTNTKKKTATPRSTVGMPKQSVTPTPKSPMLYTPDSSKPSQSRTGLSTSRPSAKKEIGPTPLSTTNKSGKRVGPTPSDPAVLTTTRKSLIMESMGDKDIVKRAFQAFGRSSLVSDAGFHTSPVTNQPVTRKTEHPGYGPGTLQKKNERISRSVKSTGACSGQGTVKESLLGLKRNTVVDQRNVKSVPSFGSRSLNLGNKSKAVFKKLEQKSMTKETGGGHTPSKAKIEKAVEIRRTSRGTNSKSNLSSSWNQGRVSKVLPKEDAKAFG